MQIRFIESLQVEWLLYYKMIVGVQEGMLTEIDNQLKLKVGQKHKDAIKFCQDS